MIKKIPQAELKVMKFIWRVDATVTSKDVIEAMEQEYGWKQTTTLTLLSRLVKKEFLYAQKIDRYTHYTIVVKQQEYLNFETKDFLSNIHNDSLVSLISALHEDEAIDKNKLDFLENYFDNLKDE
ncbi:MULTISPECIES: BlaI/MecI/CopY family transcriptional regulator [unclassified Clostridioides]|uniref:BlaI/MecI/CopY family transcriptional regulator n=1 Tax=unclassified Clostridioides TaxID=2635829 RepID=UPI001DA19E9B|nr:BlaI/MecI/CopY family transcriptional regulator [Clostridioides sp. ES-S-0001-02]MCC0639109.1 BlaI/MecI/CopY family transcriptional regulator [Clostridioides sp. ES-S-0049-03]MCC0652849.1 BlaI/MecI/CopY family transcriptional regulator [Clostridioides sp. ES-S-0001-03]MCC0657173.1 BlaI/MecI/CopY family transcriptional regulator [Clostridioides sp. ES-S-0123-01]MCC0672578.1 BlaI/MecI/CopY family transcriptional regulator [Clostridioides sp. ES-S-0145-01]MCC0675499.1 BlaI/MecI/CopY family tra